MSAVLYLKRTGFDYYPTGTTSINSHEFDLNSVRDLELMNSENLYAELKTFIETNALKASSGIIVLSADVYFQKELDVTLTPELQAAEMDAFIDTIPFNTVASKVFDIDKKKILFGANKDVLEIIMIAFSKVNILFPSAIPDVIADPAFANVHTLSEELAKSISKKADTLTTKGIAIVQEFFSSTSTEEEPTKNPKKSNRLFLLIGMFAMLIGVLVIVLLLNKNNTENERLKNAVAPTSALQPITQLPTASPSASITATPKIIEKKDVENLKVQILNGSRIAGQADIIRRDLLTIGFKTIQTGNAGSVEAANTLIVFSKNVPSAVQQKVIDEIERITNTTVSPRESSDTTFDVIITTTAPSATKVPSPSPR